MRFSVTAVLLFACLFLSASLSAQQSSSTTPAQAGPQTPQATSILQQSLAAQTGGAPVTDVTMTGTVTVTQSSGLTNDSSAGQTTTTTESGTITLVATAAGQSQLALVLPSGNWVTTENYAANPRTSTLVGPNGTTQDTVPQDLMQPSPAWFCPALLINAATAQTYVASYVDQETLNGLPVQHVAIWPQAVTSSATNSYPGVGRQMLTGPAPSAPPLPGQEDLYLNTSSMLPQAITMWTAGYKAQNNSPNLAQPVTVEEQVQFFNYQPVQGVMIPLHLQFLANGILLMDIQLSTVQFNTGVTIAAN